MSRTKKAALERGLLFLAEQLYQDARERGRNLYP